MAAACGPACRLSTTPAPKCPLHCPPIPLMVITGLSSRVAVLGPPLSQALISHPLLPPLYPHPHRRLPPPCPPTRPWPSRSFPGWKSAGRQPSRKPVHPATTLATVCSIMPVSVSSSAPPPRIAASSTSVPPSPISLSLPRYFSLHFPFSLASLFLLSHLLDPITASLFPRLVLSLSAFKTHIPGGFQGFLWLLC